MGIGAEGFGFGVLSGKGAGGCCKIRQRTFPYPVFGRFTYTLSALVVHDPGKKYMAGDILGNVRPYQTACTRTAGHRISEKPKSGFRRDPAELPEVVRGVDGRLWGFGF